MTCGDESSAVHTRNGNGRASLWKLCVPQNAKSALSTFASAVKCDTLRSSAKKVLFFPPLVCFRKATNVCKTKESIEATAGSFSFLDALSSL